MSDAIALLTAASIRAGGVLVAAWLVTLTLRKTSASARHMVWTCGVAAALLMPVLLQLPAWHIPMPAAFARMATADASVPGLQPANQGELALTPVDAPSRANPNPASAPSRPSRTGAVVLAIWLIGCDAVLLYMFLGILNTLRLRKRAVDASASWADDGRALAGAAGITHVTFAESADVTVPFASGVIDPLIVMPAATASWDPQKVRAALLHELAHVKRHDCLTQLLAQVTCAIYWFNPLVWVAAYRLRVERERACDDFVLESGVRGSDYARHLVDVAKGAVRGSALVPASGVAMAAHPTQLEGRLMSILDPHAPRTTPRITRLAVAAFGLCALGASLQLEAQTPAQTPSASNVTFDVASIRRNKEEEERRGTLLLKDANAVIAPGRSTTRPGGNFEGMRMSVRELIRDAYGYRNKPAADVIGGPSWIDSERYDIRAKAAVELPPASIVGLPPAAESALRTLLADRMKLQVRLEKRRRRVYEMELRDGKPGPNLVPSKAECTSFYAVNLAAPRPAIAPGTELPPGEKLPLRNCAMGVSLARVFGENMTMEEWARFLAAFPQIDATVIDKTNLPGRFDITVTNPAAGDGSNLLPAVQPLLESQLNIRLRPTEADVEVLVIQSVERPSEN